MAGSLILLTPLSLAAPSCARYSAEYPATVAAGTSPAVVVCEGDWNDLSTALDVSLTRCWLAIERQTILRHLALNEYGEALNPLEFSPDGQPAIEIAGRLEAELVAISGVSGLFTAAHLGTPGATDRVSIRLTCRMGVSGDAAIEACLVESVALRLKQLSGVDTAPLRWP